MNLKIAILLILLVLTNACGDNRQSEEVLVGAGSNSKGNETNQIETSRQDEAPKKHSDRREGQSDQASRAVVYDKYDGVEAGNPDEVGPHAGNAKFYLADAPLGSDAVGFIMNFKSIEFHGENSYFSFTLDSEDIDLMAYRDGERFFVGEFQLPAGKYNSVRLIAAARAKMLLNNGTELLVPLENENPNGDRPYGYLSALNPGVINDGQSIDWLMHVDLMKAFYELESSDVNLFMYSEFEIFQPILRGAVEGQLNLPGFNWICMFKEGASIESSVFCGGSTAIDKIVDFKFLIPFLEPGPYRASFFKDESTFVDFQNIIEIEANEIIDLQEISIAESIGM